MFLDDQVRLAKVFNIRYRRDKNYLVSATFILITHMSWNDTTYAICIFSAPAETFMFN